VVVVLVVVMMMMLLMRPLPMTRMTTTPPLLLQPLLEMTQHAWKQTLLSTMQSLVMQQSQQQHLRRR
jgi:hypothetical protein